MRKKMKLTVVLALVIGVIASGCSSDPTASDEYQMLESDYQSLVSDNDALSSETVALQARLEEANNATMEESSRAAESEASLEALIADRDDLAESLNAMSDDLAKVKSLAAIDVSNWLTGDDDAIADLPSETLELREDVAVVAGWFDTAADYDFIDSFRAFNMATEAAYDSGTVTLGMAWENYWDAEFRSDEEAIAWLTFQLMRLKTMIELLDEAIATAEEFAGS